MSELTKLNHIFSEFQNYPTKHKKLLHYYQKLLHHKIKNNLITKNTFQKLIIFITFYQKLKKSKPEKLINFFIEKKILEIRATSLDLLVDDFYESFEFELRWPDVWMVELVNDVLFLFGINKDDQRIKDVERISLKNNFDSKNNFNSKNDTNANYISNTNNTNYISNTNDTDDISITNDMNDISNNMNSENNMNSKNDMNSKNNMNSENDVNTNDFLDLKLELLQILSKNLIKDSQELFLSTKKYKKIGNQLVLNFIYMRKIFSKFIKFDDSIIFKFYDNIENDCQIEFDLIVEKVEMFENL